MANRDIVVVGASAGGVEALQKLVSALPADLPASVFVVLHIPPFPPSRLDQILERCSALPVEATNDGAPVQPGRIYIGVADRHLLFNDQHIRLTRGPKENRVRPAIDVLFRSAAQNFGPRVTGVVLTGNLDDGTAGLWTIKDRGGMALVQAPEEALFPSMPQSALEHVSVDRALPVVELAQQIAILSRQPLANLDTAASMTNDIEIKVALGSDEELSRIMQLGPIAANTCPSCHGVLVQIREGPIVRYRCHTGHAFSTASLFAELDDAMDKALGSALRIVEERLFLLLRLRQDAQARQDDIWAALYTRQIQQCRAWSKSIYTLTHKLEATDTTL